MNAKNLLLLLILSPSLAMAQPEGQPQTPPQDGQPPMWGGRREPMGPTKNPRVHDPVMAQGEDGKWYIFSTGMGVQVMSSPDREEWTPQRGVLEGAPEWATALVPGYRGHTWAPDIQRHDGLWYLYYSCSTFGKNQSAIGLAVNKTLDPSSPDFLWQDRGLVISSTRHQDCWNAIDPNLCITPEGDAYLFFGSFWDGIQVVRLDSDLQTPLTQPVTVARRYNHVYSLQEIDDPQHFEVEGNDTIEAADNAIEAPFVTRRGDWYYLFVSQDYCCRGRRSTYRTVYGRSHDIQGPYVDREGTPLTQGGGTLLFGPDEQYYGIGHCAVYDTGSDNWLFVSHAYDKDANGQALLFIRPLAFDADGWITLPEE